MEQKTIIKNITKELVLESALLSESLRNKNRLEKVRMCVNWVDNCCWC